MLYNRCYAFGCKSEVVAIRGGYQMAHDWEYTKSSLASAPFGVARMRVLLQSIGYAPRICFYFMGYLHVSAPYLSFPVFLYLSCSVLFPFFLSFLYFVFVLVFMLSLELCRSSSDIFLSSRPRTGLATTYITRYG